jgi:hypothetical protein
VIETISFIEREAQMLNLHALSLHLMTYLFLSDLIVLKDSPSSSTCC